MIREQTFFNNYQQKRKTNLGNQKESKDPRGRWRLKEFRKSMKV